MHGVGLLHEWLVNVCAFMHVGRVGALVKAVEGLLIGGRLTLSRVGRSVRSGAFVKHNIKCVDRLLGNAHLHAERLGIYRAMAGWLLKRCVCPVILVDWTECPSGREHVSLRAVVPFEGRGFVLYEEVHGLRRYNHPGVHRRFLRRLQEVLPPGCRPIVVSDAGFRISWFKAVEALGWAWVGRIRGAVKVRRGGGEWMAAKALHGLATPTAQALGGVELGQRQAHGCSLYLVRRYRQRRGRPRQRTSHSANAKRCRRMHREPWLIATSLQGESARRIIRLYALRMQIEESFRDLKDHHFGFALHYSRSRRIVRLQILLLIAALATVLLFLIGLAGKAKGWMRHFQANTERREPVLSILFLGRQLLQDLRLRLSTQELQTAFHELPQLIHAQCQNA